MINLLIVLLLCCSVLELLILLLFLRPLMALGQRTPGRRQTGKQYWTGPLNPGETMAVLQELQRLLKGHALSGVPCLVDVLGLIGHVQVEFGERAELESVIQQLAIQETLAVMDEQKRATRELRKVEERQLKLAQRLHGSRQHAVTSVGNGVVA